MSLTVRSSWEEMTIARTSRRGREKEGKKSWWPGVRFTHSEHPHSIPLHSRSSRIDDNRTREMYDHLVRLSFFIDVWTDESLFGIKWDSHPPPYTPPLPPPACAPDSPDRSVCYCVYDEHEKISSPLPISIPLLERCSPLASSSIPSWWSGDSCCCRVYWFFLLVYFLPSDFLPPSSAQIANWDLQPSDSRVSQDSIRGKKLIH